VVSTQGHAAIAAGNGGQALGDLITSIDRLLSARSPAEALRVVQERVELLDKAAVELLVQLEDSARAMGDERGRRGYEQRRKFLIELRTRSDTLRRAMEGLEHPPATAAPIPPEVDRAISEAVAADDVERLRAVFVAHPEARPAGVRTPDPATRAGPAERIPSEFTPKLLQVHQYLADGDQREAIAIGEQLLEQTPQDAPSFVLAGLYDLLGNAHVHLPGNRTENLRKAVAYLEKALGALPGDAPDIQRALLFHNLGNAVRMLPSEQFGANVHRAIDCFEKAQRLTTAATPKTLRGMILGNLATAYWNLPTGDLQANLEVALATMREALTLLDQNEEPSSYAVSLCNLGNIFRDRIAGDPKSNCRNAIECYEQALRLIDPARESLLLGTTLRNLGKALIRTIPPEVARAIECLTRSIGILTPETDPSGYAGSREALGRAYQLLPDGRRAENLEKAGACFEAGLEGLRPEIDPYQYGSLCHALGTNYVELAHLRDGLEDVKRAEHWLSQALQYGTPVIAPAASQATNEVLANLRFERGDWEAALLAYRDAITASERLYQTGLSVKSQSGVIEGSARLYRHAAYSAARTGRAEEAVWLMECGRTRHLREVLRVQIARPEGVPEESWREYTRAASVRANWIAKSGISPPVEAMQSRLRAIEEADASLDAAIASVRVDAPQFLKPLDLEAMRNVLGGPNVALIAFIVTRCGSLGLIVEGGAPSSPKVVHVPDFTQSDLDRLLVGTPGADRIVEEGWIGDYRRHLAMKGDRAGQSTWLECMPNRLAELGRHLIAPVLRELSRDIDHLIFMPAGGLHLLPLHAVALEHEAGKFACDRFHVSYAPSIEVLARCRDEVRKRTRTDLYAAINPGQDARLMFTEVEGEEVSNMFIERTVHLGSQATLAAFTASAQTAGYVHMSCHASFDWQDPPRSGLELARSRLTVAFLRDGSVKMPEARLVALSACETGISDALGQAPDEYVGLPAGFLISGVPCVLSTLWAVPDFSTALLMREFYRNHVRGGATIVAALRTAQLSVRDLKADSVADLAEGFCRRSPDPIRKVLFNVSRYYRSRSKADPEDRPFSHPYYWAAFSVSGDCSAGPQLEMRRRQGEGRETALGT
jgi:CHAT domain-containing protein/tetratricopeptide (TPR) repeat protein